MPEQPMKFHDVIAGYRLRVAGMMGYGRQVPCNTITGQISIYWYIGSVLTFLFYGIVLDGIKMPFHKLNRKR